jgi:SAM-dependent methyltransferase
VQHAYNVLAEKATDLDRKASPWGDSYFQQYYSWPATRAVLPDLGDSRVLLAGCGRGDYVPWFHKQGATVVGVDASETAIRHARDRFGEVAVFYHADLTAPLTFVDSDAFDLVFSNLVLSHIKEWTPVFKEFSRLLRPRGSLVVTTIHPHYLRSTADIEDYYTGTTVMKDWPSVEIPTFYRPLNAVISPFIEAGFQLQRVDEPKPQAAYEEYHPERYQDARRQPEILVVRAQVE